MAIGSELTPVVATNGAIDISTDQLLTVVSNACYWANTGTERLLVRNSGASTLTATVVSRLVVDGLQVADLVVSVPAGDMVVIGPFRRDVFNDAGGEVAASFSSADAEVLLVR